MSSFPHVDGLGFAVGFTVGFTVGLQEPQSSGQLLQLSYTAHTPSPHEAGTEDGQETFAQRLSLALIWPPS